MKAKSLNDISNQEDRLLEMNREMVAAGFILYELKWLINHEFYRTNELIKNKCDVLEIDELKSRLEILKTMRKHVDNICDKITELQKQ